MTGKFCFIQFNAERSSCDVPVPVKAMSDLKFYIDGINQLNIDIVNIGGDMVREFVHSFNYFSTGLDLSAILAPEDCFRLKLTNKDTNEVFYSNTLVYLPDCDYPLISYRCDKSKFGFHYSGTQVNSVRIPCILFKPAYEENKTSYTDSNGKDRILFTDVRKKYTFQTDYLPEEWHDKIKVALSHDLLFIDGVEYVERGTYKILEESYNLGCEDGYMGETEVAVNFVERNTNC